MAMDKRRILSYLSTIAAMLLAWQGASMVVRSAALPAPLSVMSSFAELMRGELLKHFLISFYRVAVSIILSVSLAVPLGLVLGREEKLDRFFAPFIFLTYPIPKIVFLPVILLLLGIGNLSKITLIVLIIFFQILVTTRDAARAIPAQSILSVRSLGAGWRQVYRHVVFPACLPDIFTALRISVGTAIAVLFLAESYATEEGLGYFIMDAWTRINYPEMFGGITAMALMGAVVYEALEALERRFCAWTRN
ncbi:MAG: ABC transporter permease [Actinobacteria bacterium]|nr:ABC transporter permease [Actinomycetota bacterium]